MLKEKQKKIKIATFGLLMVLLLAAVVVLSIYVGAYNQTVLSFGQTVKVNGASIIWVFISNYLILSCLTVYLIFDLIFALNNKRHKNKIRSGNFVIAALVVFSLVVTFIVSAISAGGLDMLSVLGSTASTEQAIADATIALLRDFVMFMFLGVNFVLFVLSFVNINIYAVDNFYHEDVLNLLNTYAKSEEPSFRGFLKKQEILNVFDQEVVNKNVNKVTEKEQIEMLKEQNKMLLERLEKLENTK